MSITYYPKQIDKIGYIVCEMYDVDPRSDDGIEMRRFVRDNSSEFTEFCSIVLTHHLDTGLIYKDYSLHLLVNPRSECCEEIVEQWNERILLDIFGVYINRPTHTSIIQQRLQTLQRS
jgi:hypothetical protein